MPPFFALRCTQLSQKDNFMYNKILSFIVLSAC